MNWYSSIKSSQSLQSSHLVKTAGTFTQERWEAEVGDYQRWVIDTFSCALFLTKTADMITVCLNVWNWHNSTMLFQDFWKYSLKDESKARSSYQKMKKSGQDIIYSYTRGDMYQSPNCMMFATMRKAFWNIDRENLAKTNIPHINYARQKADYEGDWRSSIYGNRYPTGATSGF